MSWFQHLSHSTFHGLYLLLTSSLDAFFFHQEYLCYVIIRVLSLVLTLSHSDQYFKSHVVLLIMDYILVLSGGLWLGAFLVARISVCLTEVLHVPAQHQMQPCKCPYIIDSLRAFSTVSQEKNQISGTSASPPCLLTTLLKLYVGGWVVGFFFILKLLLGREGFLWFDLFIYLMINCNTYELYFCQVYLDLS